MRRRDLCLLFCAATVAPRAVLAQTANRRFLIGYLSFPTKDNPLAVRYLADFLTGMRELGHIEGQDFEMVYRFADFHADRLPQLATELVQLKPDILVGVATLNAVALKKATDTIPIVIGALADPIELGLIESYGTAADIGQAYETFAMANAEVVVVEQSSMLVTAGQVIAEAAAAKKLPTLYGYKGTCRGGRPC
jgi:hypothetical protein